MHHFLNHAFTQQDLLLTHDLNLTQSLYTIYLEVQKKRGNTFFETPLILSIQQWLSQLWNETTYQSSTPSLLLTPVQSQILFHKTLKDHHISVSEKESNAMYDQWTRHESYSDLSLPFLKNRPGNVLVFQKMVSNLEYQCQKNNWIHEYQLVSLLLQSKRIDTCQLPKSIFLKDSRSYFKNYEPFLLYLEQRGCQIECLTPSIFKKCKARRVAFGDFKQEVYAMAQWAWNHWISHPKSSVGCVIPNLKSKRSVILSIFQDVYQKMYYQSFPAGSLPVHCAFKNHPMIQTAMDILQLNHSVDVSIISRLFKTPYIKHPTLLEKHQLIRLESLLKQNFSDTLSLLDLYTFIQKYCSELAILQKIMHWSAPLPQDSLKCTYSEWAALFKTQLSAWEWGEHSLFLPEEQYYFTQWSSILNHFSSLDVILKPVNRADALQSLQELIKKSTVHFVACNPGIHLVDVKDSVKYFFERVWVISSATQDSISHEALNALPSWIYHAFETIFSEASDAYRNILPDHSDQSVEIIPASLESLNLKTLPTLNAQLAPLIQWEYFYDERAPRLKVPFDAVGTNLFKAQAECPFRAFSEYRLQLGRDRDKTSSIQQLSYEKSKLFSRILTKISSYLKTQSNSTRMSSKALNTIVYKVVETESALCFEQYPTLWNPTVQQVEKNRLRHLVLQWLISEEKYPKFIVKAVNAKIDVVFKNLIVSSSVDRVDQLEDGTTRFVKYHTSLLPSRNQWFYQDASTFSLTLPSLGLKNHKQALAFLQFDPKNEVKFSGISTHITSKKRKQAIYLESTYRATSIPWKTMQNEWKMHFNKLAQQFQEGYAVVKPDSVSKSCRHCKQHLLCRIKQITRG